ncbi:MAG: hypothetical protein AAF587_09715 [Bacteroidota bacterium]
MRFRIHWIYFPLLCLLACRPDPCERRICENDGICIDGTCQCPEGFIGPECNIELDPCKIKQCVSNQTQECQVNNQKEAVCVCKDGFEGDLCQDLWTNKFKGNYDCTEACNGESLLFPVTIEEGPEFKRITIVNFHNQFNDSLMLESKVVVDLINPTVLEIKDQFMIFGLVEGAGHLQSEDLIVMNYSITTDIDTLSCHASFQRK